MSSDSGSDGHAKNVVDIDDNLRLVGTAHISSCLLYTSDAADE